MSENMIREMIIEEIRSILSERVTTNTMEIASKIGDEVDGVSIIEMNYVLDGLEGILAYDKDDQYTYQFKLMPIKKV